MEYSTQRTDVKLMGDTEMPASLHTANPADPGWCHVVTECQEVSRFNLDALTVPEALFNTILILLMFSIANLHRYPVPPPGRPGAPPLLKEIQHF